jgi:hypothetical protein
MPVPATTAAKILRPHRRALPALLAVALCALLIGPATALATVTATTSYTAPGVYSFSVPAGVTSISVTAIGAVGGASCYTSAGGEGASVSATISVVPGELLQVGVGGPGGAPNCSNYVGPGVNMAGGIGGGGEGGAGVSDELFSGGGGGGASALARSAPSPGFQAESQLIVAGGGGGGGGTGIGGGNAGSTGSPGDFEPGMGGGGGAGATQTSGGFPGASGRNCINGGNPEFGTFGFAGLGGRGGNFNEEPSGAGAGGGGGGGYYGGGGGGGGCSGGGGGGGSSFVIHTATVTEAAKPTTQPSGLTITYAAPTAETSTSSLAFTGTQPQGVASATQTLTVHNGGAAPLIVSGYTLGGTDPADYLIDDGCQAPVAAGSSCPIVARFDPEAQGPSTATLTLQTNASSAPVPVELSGTGGSLPQGPQGTQGSQGASGEEGASGAPGVQGPSGVQGTPGLAGSAGARGPRGMAGARGADGAGAIQFVSCTANAVGAPGHGPAAGPAVRTACTSQLERTPVSLPTSVTASASLTRSAHLYATGRLTAGHLVLYSRHALARGSYTLTLRWRRGTVIHTTHQQFQVA